MTSAASDRASAIFFALSSVSPDRRAAFLAEQCAGDAVLRAQVDALVGALSDHADADEPSGRPAGGGTPGPGTTIGDFIVVRPIGSGGTGVVYLAHQQHPPRVVALKILRREYLASVVQRRFEAEAELLAQLQHPGIAQVFAAYPGDDTTPPYIAMELVNGPAITDYVDAHELTVAERVALMARVCDAVQHAHQRRVIHRDLKPGNILVGEDGEPKVLDFGVARRMDVASGFTTFGTETGQLIGTLAYMSPEQVRADPAEIDTRTDIHALGVMLFRLIAGRLPFGQGDPSFPELARRILDDEPTRLGAIDPSLKGDLEVIAARAMAKEKERRYESAAALAADLRRYLSGRPISASADSAWYLLRRQLGRYRLALGLSAAALVAVSSLAVYAVLQRARAEQLGLEREQALAASTIERGRLVSLTGNHPVAEELVWRELFKRPDSQHARWALWDIYSRESTTWTRLEHEGGTLTLAFSPDGRLLATGGRVDGEVHVVAAQPGDIVHRFVLEPRSEVRRVAFTPDGAAVVAASADGSLRIWDASTGRKLVDVPRATAGLRDMTIADGGRYVATVGAGGLEFWSTADGRRSEELSRPEMRASMVRTDPTGTWLALGDNGGRVGVTRVGDRDRRWFVQGGGGMILSLAVSPDARTVVSSGIDSQLRFWNASTGKVSTTIRAENARIRSMVFDTGGNLLVVGGQWRTRIWNMHDLSAPPRDVGASDEITDLHLSADGRMLATATSGSAVRMWDLYADARADRWRSLHGGIVGITVGDGGAMLVAGTRTSFTTLRSGQPPRVTRTVEMPGATVTAVTPDGRWLATTGYPKTSAIWDAGTGRRTADLTVRSTSRALTFADEGRRVALGEATGEIRVWELSNGVPGRALTIPTGGSEVLWLVARGMTLYAAHRERVVIQRDLATAGEVRRFQTIASPFSLGLTPDGRELLVGTYSGVTEIWDLASGTRRLELKGQTSLIHAVSVSPDGKLVATSSRDGSTRLWNIEGQFLATIAARSAAATRNRFFPDGRRLAIGYDDGELEVRSLDYFFRHAAGQAEYRLRLFRQAGESFPRAHEVLAWARDVLK